MKYTDFFKKLAEKRYYVFSINDIMLFFPGERKTNVRQTLWRWRKSGMIENLKNGLYMLAYPGAYDIPDIYIANRMYQPSYVSLETALSIYGILPETAMAVASITAKPTRQFRNRHGLFTYRTVRTDAFNGYLTDRTQGYDILIAEPEKALADFIHFKLFDTGTFSAAEERLDNSIVKGLDKKKLAAYAGNFKFNLNKALYAYL